MVVCDVDSAPFRRSVTNESYWSAGYQLSESTRLPFVRFNSPTCPPYSGPLDSSTSVTSQPGAVTRYLVTPAASSMSPTSVSGTDESVEGPTSTGSREFPTVATRAPAATHAAAAAPATRIGHRRLRRPLGGRTRRPVSGITELASTTWVMLGRTSTASALRTKRLLSWSSSWLTTGPFAGA